MTIKMYESLRRPGESDQKLRIRSIRLWHAVQEQLNRLWAADARRSLKTRRKFERQALLHYGAIRTLNAVSFAPRDTAEVDLQRTKLLGAPIHVLVSFDPVGDEIGSPYR